MEYMLEPLHKPKMGSFSPSVWFLFFSNLALASSILTCETPSGTTTSFHSLLFKSKMLNLHSGLDVASWKGQRRTLFVQFESSGFAPCHVFWHWGADGRRKSRVLFQIVHLKFILQALFETSGFHGLCEPQMDFSLSERRRSSSSNVGVLHGFVVLFGFFFFLIICFYTLVFSFLNALLFIMQGDCCVLWHE